MCLKLEISRTAFIRIYKIFLLIGCVIFMCGAICPDRSQWSLTAKAKCNTTHPEYYCLFDENSQHYIESCQRAVEYQRPGFKFVIRGGLDGKLCDETHFQPIKFWTNGSSDCMFLKSGCAGEGQIISTKGNSTSDQTCKCDYTRGYAFVTDPVDQCSCLPGQDDCSCFRKLCKPWEIMSPDYECIRISDWTENFKCPTIKAQRLSTITISNTVIPEDAVKKWSNVNRYYIIFGMILGIAAVVFMCIIFIYYYTQKQAPKHFKSCIQEHYREIIQTIKHEDIVTRLIEIGAFNDRDREYIEAADCQFKKNHRLLKLIWKGGDKTFRKFLSALQHLGCYKNLLEKIRITLENVNDELDAMLEEFEQEEESEKYKKCLKANYKDIVTTIKYNTIVEYLISKSILSDSDRKHVETGQGLTKRNHKLIEIIWNRGLNAYNEFIAALRLEDSYAKLADRIEQTNVYFSDELETKMTELEEEQNEKIPKKTREIHLLHLTNWLEEDKTFMPTNAMKNVEKQLHNNNCVLLAGLSGNGKSSIIRHIALRMWQEDGFDIIPNVMGPSDIKSYHNPLRNQLFIIDDFCGKDRINGEVADIWASQITEIQELLNNTNKMTTKLLIACQTTIYENEQFKDLRILDQYKLNLSDCPLTDKEKSDMIAMYATNYGIEGLNFNQECYPLLCRLSTGKTLNEIKDLFQEPYIWIEEDLKGMQQIDPLQFCVITLCTLFDNEIKIEWFKDIPLNKKDAMQYILEESNLKLNDELTMRRMLEQLDTTKMTYMTKTGDLYHFIHKDIYDIASVVCGKAYTNFFIDHASCFFIGERYCLEKQIASNYDYTSNACRKKYPRSQRIVLTNEYTERYFNRLVKDLKNGNTYSSFHNFQLEDDSYRSNFCLFCRKNLAKFKDILKQFKQSEQMEKCDITLNKPGDDYINLRSIDFFKSHKTLLPLIEAAWEGYTDIVNLLVEMQLGVNETDRFGRSAVFVASLRGKEKVVRLLVDNHADILRCDNKSRSPLYAACDEGHYDIVKFLISKNADLSKCDTEGRAPLHVSCAGGHRGIIELLLEQNKNLVNKRDIRGQTPLFHAVAKGHRHLINLLIQNNASVNEYDSEEYTPLYIACKEGYDEIVEILISQKADILKCDLHGKSPLLIACYEGRANAVTIIAREKQNVDQCDHDGTSPLYIACEKGNDKIVNILLQYKAKVNICDRQKRSPLYVACKRGHLEIVKLLLDNGANMLICNQWQDSPLHIACREGHKPVVEYLLSKHVDVSRCNERGFSPLHVACREGHPDIVKLLLKEKKDLINICDRDMQTPLHAAALGGHKNVVQILIDHHAKYSEDKNGQLPETLALKHGYGSIVDLLKAKGNTS